MLRYSHHGRRSYNDEAVLRQGSGRITRAAGGCHGHDGHDQQNVGLRAEAIRCMLYEVRCSHQGHDSHQGLVATTAK